MLQNLPIMLCCTAPKMYQIILVKLSRVRNIIAGVGRFVYSNLPFAHQFRLRRGSKLAK